MKDDSTHIARLWKTGRLLAGYTQTKLSKALEIPQSSVSKFESGVLEPSALDWYRFCELVGIDAHRSLTLKFIDGRQKFRDGIYLGNLFNIPFRYRLDQSLKIRELFPFRMAVIKLFGKQEWNAFLEILRIPDELFYVLDFQVSIGLLFDILALTEGKQSDLIQRALEVHLELQGQGILGSEYVKKKNLIDFSDAYVGARDHYQKAIDIDLIQRSSRSEVTFRVQDIVLNSFDKINIEVYHDYKIQSFIQLTHSLYPSVSFETQYNHSKVHVYLESG